MPWNHNIRYHLFALGQMPPNCQRVLDVGCGRGALTQKLARLSKEVTGIDTDRDCLNYARKASSDTNIEFLEGNVMEAPLPLDSFDFIVAVATLHHLPLHAALKQFRDLLRPGGILVVVGLYKVATPIDYAYSTAAMPLSMAIRFLRGEEETGAPLKDPSETLRAIRKESASVLPGAAIRRRLFFRYSLVWQKDICP